MDAQVEMTADSDMTEKPKKKLTRKTKVKIGEHFHTVKDAAEMRGLTYDKVWRRVIALGWTIRQALEIDSRRDAFPSWKQITVGTETRSLYYWCDITGVNPDTARRRITQLKWPPAQAVEMEPRVIIDDKRKVPPMDRPIIRITYKGKTQDLMQWAAELGIPYRTLYDRKVRQKLTIPEILCTKRYTAKNSPSYKGRGGRYSPQKEKERAEAQARAKAKAKEQEKEVAE
jgi:hypothetical protein